MPSASRISSCSAMTEAAGGAEPPGRPVPTIPSTRDRSGATCTPRSTSARAYSPATWPWTGTTYVAGVADRARAPTGATCRRTRSSPRARSGPGSRRWHPEGSSRSANRSRNCSHCWTTASRNPARTVSATSGCASSGAASRATSPTAARPLSPDPRLVDIAIAPMKSSSPIGATPSSPPVAAMYVRLPLASRPVAIGIDAARIAGSNAGATSVDSRSAVSTKRGLAGSRSRSSKSSVTSAPEGRGGRRSPG